MASRTINATIMRYDTRDQEKWRRQFKALGPDSEAVFDKMTRASRPANDNLKAVDVTVGELKGGVSQLTNQLGPFGRILQSLGPIGAAVAVTLGVVTAAAIGLFNAVKDARQAGAFADDLQRISDASGVSALRMLEWRDAIALAGGELASADRTIEEFYKRIGEFRGFGTGEAREGLALLGLDDDVREGLVETGDLLTLVVDRLAEIDDPDLRLSIADKMGLRDAAPLLAQGAAGIADIRTQLTGLTQELSDADIERFAELERQIALVERQIERTNVAMRGELLPLARMWSDFKLGFARDMADTFGRFQSLDARTEAVLERRIVQLQARIASNQELLERFPTNLALSQSIERDLGRLEEIMREQGRRARRAYLDGFQWRGPLADPEQAIITPDPDSSGGGSDTATLADQQAAQTRLAAAMQAARTPAERLAEAARQLREDYASLTDEQRASLGITEAWIARAIAAQRVTLGLADATSQLSRAERDKRHAAEAATAAAQAWAAIAERNITVEAEAAQRIKDVNEALRERLVFLEQMPDGAVRAASIAEAEAAAGAEIKRTTAALQARAEAMRAGSAANADQLALEELKLDIMNRVIDVEGSMAERRRQLNTLVEAGTIHQAKANQELANYHRELLALDADAQGFSGLAKLMRDSDDLRGALDNVAVGAFGDMSRGLVDLVRDFDNAGQAASRFFENLVAGLLELAVQQAIIGPLASALSGFLGGLFPQTAAAGADGGFNFQFGGPDAPPLFSSDAADAAFAASRSDKRPPPPPGDISVNLNNAPAGTEASATAQRNGDGSVSIDVMFDKQITRSASQGQLGKILKSRGVGKSVTRRGGL